MCGLHKPPSGLRVDCLYPPCSEVSWVVGSASRHLRLTTAPVADTKIASSVLSPLFPDTLPTSGCRACRRHLRSQTFRPELSTLYPDTPPASACRARSERRSVGNLRLLIRAVRTGIPLYVLRSARTAHFHLSPTRQ